MKEYRPLFKIGAEQDPFKLYDEKGNVVYFESTEGERRWYHHTPNGQSMRVVYPSGFEEQIVSDSDGKIIYYENSQGKVEIGNQPEKRQLMIAQTSKETR